MNDRSLEITPALKQINAGTKLRLQARRRRKNALAITLSMLAMAFGLWWLLWILYTTITLGIGGLSLNLFVAATPPPGSAGGGLANAIVGSLILVSLATLIGTPLGILAGVYLAEYGQSSWAASLIRFINDILLSAPSIVIGLFVAGGRWLNRLTRFERPARFLTASTVGGDAAEVR